MENEVRGMTMRRFLIIVMLCLFGITAQAKEDEPSNLHAQSAVLMDADSGRVLFAKNGEKIMPMASTTKIMTCILTLEMADVDSIVTVSTKAARQPKVHLEMKEGEQFYLRDLLYSLMLESHNDSAVAIAEHVSGSVEEFAKAMNQKAKEIGCQNTYYITPNGLDASDEKGVHSTTAEELAKVMRYCIMKSPQKSLFLKITGASEKIFENVAGTRTFSCRNHNAFLTMMEGAIAGKTGFTNDAGYCYVGALERDGRTFIVALLACGWPNNKGYKWTDTRKLMTYGIDHYQYREVFQERVYPQIHIKNGIPKGQTLFGKAMATIDMDVGEEDRSFKVLLRENERVKIETKIVPYLEAPVQYGQVAGTVTYYLDDKKIKRYNLIITQKVEKKDFEWYFKKIAQQYFVVS